MIKSFKLFAFASFLVLVCLSCKTENNSNDNRVLSTDIIQNSLTASGEVKSEGLPEISFDKSVHDFGAIIEGEVVEYTFNYTNTGGSDLVLTKVSASCGCTIPKYDTKPVAPGEKGKIVVAFNSENRKGNQNKTVKVLANTQPNLTELTISANIIY